MGEVIERNCGKNLSNTICEADTDIRVMHGSKRVKKFKQNAINGVVPKSAAKHFRLKSENEFFSSWQYFSEIAQNPETNQRKPSSQSWTAIRDPAHSTVFQQPQLQRRTSSSNSTFERSVGTGSARPCASLIWLKQLSDAATRKVHTREK